MSERIEKNMLCPLLGKDCVGEKCVMWTEFVRKESDKIAVDKGCGIAALPALMVNLQNRLVGTQGAIESFRNEVVNAGNKWADIERGKLELAEEHFRLRGAR